MRRGTLVPGLLALVLGALIILGRRIRAARRQASVAAAPPVAPLSPAPSEAEAPHGPRFLSVAWTLAEPPTDEVELTISFARSQHEALDRVDVQETPTQVFVTVIVRWLPHVGGPFAADIDETATVVLGRPLGERELIHGATDVDDVGARPLYP